MSVTSAGLVRLCEPQDWSRAQAVGRIDPDEGEGFVHLSTLDQVHLPANRLYRGRRDLVLLHVDASLLDAPLRWELGVPTDPESMLFPHLYGPLPVRAVTKATAYLPGGDGSFAPAQAHDST
ncbi:hypothetical protein MKUB_18450 [Mycobacterium kubicae]|uniref:DUF952 domain-containing protein n=1 Tax=Mycobacterium kubicae TaxID=120959 RepID=A0AAX1JGP2_9MYCO|nr:DUF952 domain-containing protein [Mycobacterium kubicae]MCV7097102.1 DUF952 domain-containing protein [Mycobacterium kubicae]ORW03173.1 glutathione S-transferase [Mycobacterium kubicae]QNI11511.1 DUF952 domain-containing protein [Mycobacterium kubicae]QPI39730.1 DUF952 domain-containing protein [Mycobacterium kubicae]GFG64355.1 hypothetical protein MKUB_18450 [Mycobacterium kubicae]